MPNLFAEGSRLTARAAILLAAIAPIRLFAADDHATGSGSWEDPSLWSLGQTPSSSDDNDDIDNTIGSALTITGTTTGSFPSTLQINNLSIGSASAANSLTLDATASGSVPLTIASQLTVDQTGTLNINGGAITAAAADFGDFGSGAAQQTAGSLNVSGDLHLGRHDGGNGQYTLQSGTLAVGLTEYIGQAFSTVNAAGLFVQSGGMHTVGNQLHVGDQSVGSGSYQMNGGTLVVTNGIIVGDVGSFVQTGGTVNLNNGGGLADLTVGGSYTMHSTNSADPSALNVASTEYVGTTTGNAALGTFLQDGGTQTITGNLTLARDAGSTASYTLSGGTLSARNVYVGGDTGAAGGAATFAISNGGIATIGSVQNGALTGTVHVWSGGTFNINAGGTLNTGTMINDGIINNGGGAYTYSGTITGSGTINQTAGSSTIANGTTLDTGSLNIKGGTATGTGNLLIATNSGATGNLSITGGATTINGVLGVGNDGTLTGGSTSASGTVDVSGGSLTAGEIILGNNQGSDGALFIKVGPIKCQGLNANDVTLSGGSLTVGTQAAPAGTDPVIANSIVGGYMRNGALNVNGGTVTTPTIKLGITAGNTGTFTQTTGTVNVGVLGVGNDATLTGGAGTGTASVSGGTLNADTILLGNTSGTGGGSLTVSGTGQVNVGGGLSMNDLTMNGGALTVADQNPPAGEDPVLNRSIVGGYMHNGAMYMNDGTVSTPYLKVGIDHQGTYVQTGGAISITTQLVANQGANSIVTLTGGTMNLYAADINTGSALTVGDGTHLFNLNLTGGTLKAAQGIIVSSSGHLSGIGNITGDVSSSGTISPGDAPGTIGISGNFSSSGALDFGIASPNSYDRISLPTGIFTAGGTIDVSLLNHDSPNVGDVYKIMDFATLVDEGYTFDFSNATLGPRKSWDTSAFSLNGIIDVVPEPGALSMIALGATGLLKRRCRTHAIAN